MICPACEIGRGQLLRSHTYEAAAEHFVPVARDPERHARLAAHMRALWGQDRVDVEVCQHCAFGFSVPFVGGDAQFYALANDGDPHYPRDRWEFGQGAIAVGGLSSTAPLRLLEVGAGHGAFLDRVRQLDQPTEITAADYDEGAVKTLRNKGYNAVKGSLSDMRGPFDVVCLFQTLEHMADLDQVFADLSRLLAPGGSVLLSVPNGQATSFQEGATGLWDMPPNHVGRWTQLAIRLAAEARGFGVVAVRAQPIDVRATTWQLAVHSVNARAYDRGAIERRVNSLGWRPLRGALKRILAISRVPGLWRKRHRYQPLTCFAHLRVL